MGLRVRGLLAWVALGCLAFPAWADTVEMNNGLKIDGKIHLETPEFIVLLVHNESGRVRIPRKDIKSIDYDFASKAANLKDDDYKGHYDLGVWAMGKGKYAEAIQEFERVKGQAGAGPDLYKLLGQAYEKRTQFDKAYEQYKEHLRLQPGDAEIKKRVDELAKQLGVGATTAQKPQIKDGLEVDFQWSPEKWNNSNPCTVQLTSDKDTGNRMLVLQAPGGTKDKLAFGGTGQPLDLTESKEIICKVFHNGVAPIEFAVAFKNQAGDFFETDQKRAAPNSWVNLIVPIAGKSFKSTRNQFSSYTDTLEGKDRIKQIYVLIYGPCAQRELTLYVDHIFFR